MFPRSFAAVLYFDHNATSPLSAVARAAWLEATERFIGNPSSQHRVGQRAEVALSGARERLAQILGCAAGEIVWTSGATESNNAAVAHAAATRAGDAWISAVEHPSVLEPVRRCFRGRFQLQPVTRSGRVEVAWLAERLQRGTPAFVAVMAANNETGVIQPWREVAALCAEREVPFLCDASQWLGKLPAAGLGKSAMVSGCAHKFGGPTGVGFLQVPPGAPFTALLAGGPQEDGRRAGTENVAGVLAMVAALEDREAALREPGWIDERTLNREDFVQRLSLRLPGAQVLGAGEPCLWNTVAIIAPESPDCRPRWVVKLDKLGFAVSTGSACASGKEEPSHVLAAMGRSAAEAGRVLRFSGGWETRPADWSELLNGLVRVSEELGRRA